MDEFDTWAPYYDFVHRGLPGELEYYLALATAQDGPVLELGCGTGRLCIPMAMAGVSVTALDISQNMLALCREKAFLMGDAITVPLDIRYGDMRQFDLGQSYPLILMAYRTFMHLLTSEDQVQCLHCVRRHLAPHGRFVCNFWAPRPSILAPLLAPSSPENFQLAGVYPVPGEDITLVHFHRAEYDEHRQWIREWHRIQEKDKDGTVIREERMELTRAWTTPREMEHLAARCGLAVETLHGGFRGEAFGPQSSESLWVFRTAN